MKNELTRTIEIITPLEKDMLLPHRMRGKEELGRLFEYELDLLSTDPTVPLDEVLGQTLTITLRRPEEEGRYFNGFCTRISQGGKRGRYYTYSATVSPWLWFLTRTTNCRIFQEKTVPDIIKEIFAQHSAIVDVKDELTETYTPWEYCVQYRESDFDFISRLMEMEGIYYFFTHVEGRHTMVLADSYSAHMLAKEEDIPYIPPGKVVRPDLEHIPEWTINREVRPGKYALRDFDFERPSVDLQVKTNFQREHALAEYEIYDYPGDYIQRSDGEQYARLRIEEEQAKYEQVSGTTNWRSMATGALFKLGGYPRTDQNAEYLIVSTDIELQSSEYESLDDPGTPAVPYSCSFKALNSHQPFRSERVTKKPMVRGPQTAMVVGPGGETIHTDKYGRVKVHFHWDRYGKYDDTASCWIRVSQNWGGKNWGGMFIPHVGQEVIVMFEEGDPDRPIVTGRVYNAEQMPPVELPAGKTKSIIRDHGSNEIVMEGDDGKQRITMYSPTANTKFSMGAPNSPTPGFFFLTDEEWNATVMANQKTHVEGDVTQTVHGSSHYYVKGNYITQVDGYQEYSTLGHYNTKVGGWNWTTIDGYNQTIIGGDNLSRVNGSSISEIFGSETTVTIGFKNELLLAFNQRLTAGFLTEINQTAILSKTPEDSLVAGFLNEKLGKVRQSVGSYLREIADLKQKVTNLQEKLGTYEGTVTGSYKLEGAPISITSKGKMELNAPDVHVDKDLIVEGDLVVGGTAFSFGGVFKATS